MSGRIPAPAFRIKGYASLFGIADEGGDTVMAGAFRRSLRQRSASGIRFLWQHDPARPIGVWEEMREDERGLFVRGSLIAGLPLADEARLLIRAGAVDGLSIGFRARNALRDPRSGTRRLYDIDLWEISLVTFPQQSFARLDTRSAELAAEAEFSPAARAICRASLTLEYCDT
ncbi:HK97 family phage prohead protease [Stappia sp. F7233]|uniref:HK97 family phage prohead protease n=1 Tax=Stappia albiluteola TaxID=2758565 RepID=A0A839A9P8_9HYPH|nr:HK97 family phage prohead protease [Stappia albiluteola]MBA5776360.1 HK97 family phage prohead protease [Stappia albiluteola]